MGQLSTAGYALVVEGVSRLDQERFAGTGSPALAVLGGPPALGHHIVEAI